LTPLAQPTEGATQAPQIRKEDGLIDWERPAPVIDRQIRAYTPWPGAYTFWGQHRLKIVKARPLPPLRPQAEPPHGPPGTVNQTNKHPIVTTGDGLLELERLQAAGKRALSGADFIRGRPDFIGACLGTT
jgi:methionyl-tRNA formyltransferase